MEAHVDSTLCISCGLCVELAPDVFQFDSEGISSAIGPVNDFNRAAVVQSAEACPTAAISVTA